MKKAFTAGFEAVKTAEQLFQMDGKLMFGLT
jgi:hypothetical protein